MSNGNIVFDLDKITRREFNQWREDREGFSNPSKRERFDFETLYQRIIVSWPYGEVSFENFEGLTLGQSQNVDRQITEALTAQKKSAT